MRISGLMILLVSLATWQGNSYAQDLKTTYYASVYSQLESLGPSPAVTIHEFCQKLERKRDDFKHERDFIRYVFERTHQQFLRRYTQYTTFNNLFNKSGTYNCLTGTALLALTLDNLRVPYRIVETNYHIFILASTSNGDVLLESTDAANGVLTNSTAIATRIAEYRQNAPLESANAKVYYRYTADIYNDVNLDGLAGLMHYNLAIVAYNNQHLAESITHLGKALELHPSPRIEEFSRIIQLSVSQSNLDMATKEKYLKNIQVLRKKHVAVTASAQ